jgi:hypothetical protein
METISNKKFSEVEFNRFGLISVIITVVGCMGGIAVGMGAVQSTLSLAIVILPTMATLSLLLAVAPMKQILIAAAVSVLIDIMVVLYYIFN